VTCWGWRLFGGGALFYLGVVFFWFVGAGGAGVGEGGGWSGGGNCFFLFGGLFGGSFGVVLCWFGANKNGLVRKSPAFLNRFTDEKAH